WKPDYGPENIHPTAGVTAIGARMHLIAYNVNLSTNNIEIANKIAKNIRHINGGFRYVKAIGIELEDRNIVQVSINLTDYTKTSIYRVFETIKMEASRYGINIIGSEIVGLLPMQALVDTADYYLRLENFKIDQILETRF
ncbi:MAG: glutamate formiminotransferase, partial [Tissierellia bacterium]|nr:glutamate formiminotransferase [Tissierellia bacterium]